MGGFWQALLRETKNGMSRRLINVNASMLVMAGMETSSTALKAITYLLVSNPDKLQKLAREVRALPKRSDLNSKNLQTLVYLNAVISEGLRLFPSGQAALAAQRRIAPGGNFVCGEFLPQYTQVFMAAHAMNNSPLFWKAPHEFVPERWIPEETAFSEYHDYDKFQVRLPFGYGPRMCIGKNIAYHELRGVLASLVYEFDLASTRETVEWLYIKSSNVWSKPDLKVRASRR
ncbi:hypothetical protein MCOR25_010866 [Pyricularia grisea]|nr:hypothetical protein MCOR25_010866 [Pyricularia grisea]